MMMEPLGFVFDLDDTLYPECEYVRSCFFWIAPRLGAAECFDELWRRFGARERDPIGAVAAARGVSADETAALVAQMRAHAPDIALDDGAEALIGALRSAGRKFSIVTNGRAATQRAKIAALGVEDAAAIIISDEFGAEKPEVSLFRAVERVHLARRHLFVGDNPAIDFGGPSALGWNTAMLERRNGVPRDPVALSPAQRAERVIASLADLLPLI
jgi:putative hydrolase of the HAD superfamily